MQSPFSFIVRPVNGTRYDNVKKIGDLDFLISVSKEDHKAANRYAQVVSTPINYSGDVNIGDILLVKAFLKTIYSLLTLINFFCIIIKKSGKVILNIVL